MAETNDKRDSLSGTPPILRDRPDRRQAGQRIITSEIETGVELEPAGLAPSRVSRFIHRAWSRLWLSTGGRLVSQLGDMVGRPVVGGPWTYKDKTGYWSMSLDAEDDSDTHDFEVWSHSVQVIADFAIVEVQLGHDGISYPMQVFATPFVSDTANAYCGSLVFIPWRFRHIKVISRIRYANTTVLIRAYRQGNYPS